MSNRLARIDALASTAGSDDVGDPCEPKNTKILKPELIVWPTYLTEISRANYQSGLVLEGRFVGFRIEHLRLGGGQERSGTYWPTTKQGLTALGLTLVYVLHSIRVTRILELTSVTNLTLAIDDHLLHRARVRAAEEETSVNAVVREMLASYSAVDRLDAARRRLIALSVSSAAGSGGRPIAGDLSVNVVE